MQHNILHADENLCFIFRLDNVLEASRFLSSTIIVKQFKFWY